MSILTEGLNTLISGVPGEITAEDGSTTDMPVEHKHVLMASAYVGVASFFGGVYAANQNMLPSALNIGA